MAQILLAEDDTSMREFLAKSLRRAGHSVVAVGDGLDALESIADSPVDLLLADVVMPGLDGLELVEAIRDQYPSLPIILMTAHGSAEIAMQALRKGAASYVPKSELSTRLVDTAADILELQRSRRKLEQREIRLFKDWPEQHRCCRRRREGHVLCIREHVERRRREGRIGGDRTRIGAHQPAGVRHRHRRRVAVVGVHAARVVGQPWLRWPSHHLRVPPTRRTGRIGRQSR